jgi:hypothetical protein
MPQEEAKVGKGHGCTGAATQPRRAEIFISLAINVSKLVRTSLFGTVQM